MHLLHTLSLQELIYPKYFNTFSFFAGYGKTRVMNSFYQYSDFITGGVKAPGILTDISANGEGFLSFLRLVGCFYFKKHKAAFPNPSPYNLYHECEGTRIIKHKAWLRIIRDTVWERTEYEDSHVPSVEALHYHWLRCCWVSYYWSQANVQNVTPLDLLGHDWAIENQTLKIVWDSQENIERVRENVIFLTSKGCSCKGNCSTCRCKCSKQHKNCRANCKCSDCENPHKDGK